MNIFTKISNWWKALFSKKTIDAPTVDVPQSSASHIYVPQTVLESPQVAPVEMANVPLSKSKKKKHHVPSRGRVQYYKRNNVWVDQYDVFVVDLDLIGLLEELVLLGFNPNVPFYYDDQYAPNDYVIMYPPTTDGVVCEPINLFEPLTVDNRIESPVYNPIYNEPIQEDAPVQDDPIVTFAPDPEPTYVSYTPSYSSNDDSSSGSSSSSGWGSSSDSSSSSSSWSDSSSSSDYSSSDSSSCDSSSSSD